MHTFVYGAHIQQVSHSCLIESAQLTHQSFSFPDLPNPQGNLDPSIPTLHLVRTRRSLAHTDEGARVHWQGPCSPLSKSQPALPSLEAPPSPPAANPKPHIKDMPFLDRYSLGNRYSNSSLLSDNSIDTWCSGPSSQTQRPRSSPHSGAGAHSGSSSTLCRILRNILRERYCWPRMLSQNAVTLRCILN